jgi:hypothetical protein
LELAILLAGPSLPQIAAGVLAQEQRHGRWRDFDLFRPVALAEVTALMALYEWQRAKNEACWRRI